MHRAACVGDKHQQPSKAIPGTTVRRPAQPSRKHVLDPFRSLLTKDLIVHREATGAFLPWKAKVLEYAGRKIDSKDDPCQRSPDRQNRNGPEQRAHRLHALAHKNV